MSGEKGQIQPIAPEAVAGKKLEQIPNEVIDVFNELIIQNAVNGTSRVLKKDVVELMVKKGLPREDIIKKGWLDVEEVYQEAGWKVEYDKPGFNETGEPSFTFKASRRKSQSTT